MSTIGQRIRKKRIELGLSVDDLAGLLSKNRATIYRYESDEIENLPLPIIEPLAAALSTTPAYLMGWTDVVSDDYKVMESIEKVLSKIPLYENVVSAGGGAWLADGHEYTYLYLEDVPENADFALRVRGDSMEPMYSDDDIVFVRANSLVENGQVGVFCLNNEGYLKMLQGNKLVSFNEEYDPVIMKTWDDYFPVGRVVGKTRID